MRSLDKIQRNPGKRFPAPGFHFVVSGLRYWTRRTATRISKCKIKRLRRSLMFGRRFGKCLLQPGTPSHQQSRHSASDRLQHASSLHNHPFPSANFSLLRLFLTSRLLYRASRYSNKSNPLTRCFRHVVLERRYSVAPHHDLAHGAGHGAQPRHTGNRGRMARRGPYGRANSINSSLRISH